MGDVEAAVRTVSELYRAGALETALAIGAYVLGVYLGGDEGRFALGDEEPSLRALAEHPGLRMPRSSLWMALKVSRQFPELPEEVRRLLGISHHQLLLAVRDPKAKARIARAAAEQGLSARGMRKVVDRYLETRHLPPIGGPAVHPGLTALKKGANAVLRAAQALEEGARPSAADRAELARQAHLVELRMARVRAALPAGEKSSRKAR